jgi:hypothetical protein
MTDSDDGTRMPAQIRHEVPAALKLGAGPDVSVGVLAFATLEDETALQEWVASLIDTRQVIDGAVVRALYGDRAVAILRTHPDRVREIADGRPDYVRELVALPRVAALS